MVNKSDIIEKVYEKFDGLTKDEVKLIVNSIVDEIATTIERGGRVELRGFGTFSTRTRKAGKARNPKTGEVIEIGERKTIYFRAGSGLKGKLNS